MRNTANRRALAEEDDDVRPILLESNTEISLGNESTQREKFSKVPRFGTRHIFVLLLTFGLFNVYAMRVNLSIAIVAMVNNTALNGRNESDPDQEQYIGPSSQVLLKSFRPLLDANNASCMADIEPPLSNNTGRALPDGPFAWDETTQSFVLSCFFYGYVLPQIPAGFAAQKYGGKWILGIGVLLTSIFTILAPIAAKLNYTLFIGTRIIAGLGEGVTFPAMAAMISEWTPPLERSRTCTVIGAGTTLGAIVSMAVTGLICEDLGWEGAFYIFGLLGLVWFIFWTCLVFDSPRCHPHITDAERDLIEISLGKRSISSPLKLQGEDPDHQPCEGDSSDAQVIQSTQRVPWMSILTSGPVYAVLFATMASSFAFYMLLTEAPTFIKQVLQVGLTKDSVISSTPYFVNIPVSIIASCLADWIIANEYLSITNTRRVFNTIAFWCPAAALIAIGYSGCNKSLAIFLLCITGLSGLGSSSFGVNPIDIAPNFSGVVIGLCNCLASTMGFVAPTITGQIIKKGDDMYHWRLAFTIGGVVLIIGNILYCFLASGYPQAWNFPPRQNWSQGRLSSRRQGPLEESNDHLDEIVY